MIRTLNVFVYLYCAFHRIFRLDTCLLLIFTNSSSLSVSPKEFFLGHTNDINRYFQWDEMCAKEGGISSKLASINNAAEQKMVYNLLRKQKTVVLTGMRIDFRNVTDLVSHERKKGPYS